MEHKYYIPFSGGSRISQMVRGRQPCCGVASLSFGKLFGESCMKMKEIGPKRGRSPAPSRGSAYAILSLGAQTQLCAVRNEDWRTVMISLYMYILPSSECFLLCETTLSIKKMFDCIVLLQITSEYNCLDQNSIITK